MKQTCLTSNANAAVALIDGDLVLSKEMVLLRQIMQILLNPPRQHFLQPVLSLGVATQELEI